METVTLLDRACVARARDRKSAAGLFARRSGGVVRACVRRLGRGRLAGGGEQTWNGSLGRTGKHAKSSIDCALQNLKLGGLQLENCVALRENLRVARAQRGWMLQGGRLRPFATVGSLRFVGVFVGSPALSVFCRTVCTCLDRDVLRFFHASQRRPKTTRVCLRELLESSEKTRTECRTSKIAFVPGTTRKSIIPTAIRVVGFACARFRAFSLR